MPQNARAMPNVCARSMIDELLPLKSFGKAGAYDTVHYTMVWVWIKQSNLWLL